MSLFLFNFNDLELNPVEGIDPSQKEVEATPTLRRPSLETASMFGGPLVRSLLETAPLLGNRKYVTVDTKVSLLMPGWYPAIPGWHTDGVPRGESLRPDAKGNPRLDKQSAYATDSPHYHVISVGLDSPTEFVNEPVMLPLDNYDNPDLYKEMTEKVSPLVDSGEIKTFAESNTWVTWDWWTIHRAVPANGTGWRLLIRITESDVVEPRTEDFIRAQSQVYVPIEFGW